jgi:hypothetical protein
MATETEGVCLGPILGRAMMHDDNNYVHPFEMMGEGACRGRLKPISQKNLHGNSVRITVKSKKALNVT